MPLTLTAASTEFVSLAEVRDHVNVTGDRSDVELDMMRGAAQDVVEGLVGPVLHRTVTDRSWPRGGLVMLSVVPVLSVTSVTANAVAVSGSVLESGGLLSGVTGYGPVTVAYVVGRLVVPDAIRLATLIIAAHLWRTQQGSTPASFGDDVTATPIGFAVPNRAVELLRPYELGPVVA